jgi:hypothetical protein
MTLLSARGSPKDRPASMAPPASAARLQSSFARTGHIGREGGFVSQR